MHMTRLLLAAAGALVLACGPSGAGDGTAASGPSRSASGQSRDPGIVSLEETEPTQVYYQFVDERGRVRFVSTLAEVPEDWRARVGFVEMSSPPPDRPADAQRLRDRRTAHVRVPASAGAGSPAAAGNRSDVILYGADWCGACRMAKQYMDDKGIAYDERNVDEPQWAEEMRAKAGPGGIPVIDVGGQILRGFSAARLDQMLKS
jgi:glutaredoxin